VPDASPSWHPRALHLLSLPNHSLLDVADTLNIPLHQLARFVLSQPALEAATDIQAASIIHARTAAAASLPKVVSVLSQTLDDFLKTNACARAFHEPDTLNPNTHDSAKATTTTTPSTEARHLRALRAAHLLVRLANFQPKPLRASDPRGTGGGLPPSASAQPTANHTPALPLTTIALNTLRNGAPHENAAAAPQLPTNQPTPLISPTADDAEGAPPRSHAVSARCEEPALTPTATIITPAAPGAADRCEGRGEALRASPSTDQALPSPPLGRTNNQQPPTDPRSTSAAPQTTDPDAVNIAPSSSSSLMPDAQCLMPSSLHPP